MKRHASEEYSGRDPKVARSVGEEGGGRATHRSGSPEQDQGHVHGQGRVWNSLALPEGWEDCPPYGESVRGLIPSKVPLGKGFKEVIEPGKRYSPETAMRQLRHQHREVGLVIDLTKTTRYYNPREWTDSDVRYIKLPCGGFEEVPDEETVNKFVFEVQRFHVAEQLKYSQDLQRQKQQGQQNGGAHSGPVRLQKHILVHCTHGHNRTGYCMVHYLMRYHGGTVAQWLEEFARARPPGIYKEEYIADLFRFYHEPRPEQVLCPATPEWKRLAEGQGGVDEVDGEGDGDEGSVRGLELDLNEALRQNEDEEEDEDGAQEEERTANGPGGPEGGAMREGEGGQHGGAGEGGGHKEMTNDDVLGSAISPDHQIELQKIVHRGVAGPDPAPEMNPQNMNLRRLQMFPGSQPVSLSSKNLMLLQQRLYHVTWKADGMRYMMLLCQDGCYLIDRNFRFRRLQLRFPSPSSPLGVHSCTLLDGEMVIDTITAPAKEEGAPPVQVRQRRYLIYDAVMINAKSIANKPFGARWMAIEDEILVPRSKDKMLMQKLGLYDYDKECVKVRRKDFWMLSATEKLLRSFIPKLCHESDGLIFQGWIDHYVPRTHEGLLKWKYAHMNSVDFLLQRTKEGGEWVLLLMDRGSLKRLEGAKVVFPDMTEEEAVAKLEGKVVECSWRADEGVWEYMRPRPDKEHPNAWGTYQKVMDSIQDNITEEVLLQRIQKARKLPLYENHEQQFEKDMKQRHMRLMQQHHQQQQQQHHHHQKHIHHQQQQHRKPE